MRYFYGYKAHTAMNVESQMITCVSVAGGNAPDGKQFPGRLEKGREHGLQIEIYTADRGCDDTKNHCLLETLGMYSAIVLKDYRTQKKEKNKEV